MSSSSDVYTVASATLVRKDKSGRLLMWADWKGYGLAERSWVLKKDVLDDHLLFCAKEATKATDFEWRFYVETANSVHAAGWHPFEAAAQKTLEEAWVKFADRGKGPAEVTVRSGKFDYVVSFETMTEKNVQTNTIRFIKRHVGTYPGMPKGWQPGMTITILG